MKLKAVFAIVPVLLLAYLIHKPTNEARESVAAITGEQREALATLINLNGKLCAHVVEAAHREGRSYYVECEERRDSIKRVAYYVDLATGKVR